MTANTVSLKPMTKPITLTKPKFLKATPSVARFLGSAISFVIIPVQAPITSAFIKIVAPEVGGELNKLFSSPPLMITISPVERT